MKHRTSVLLAAIGDANSPITWSGIPYHLLQAGRRAGAIDEGLDLSVSGWGWKARRLMWNIAQVAVSLGRHGGYQYSDAFLERLWAPARDTIRGAIVINCFQLFAPSVIENSAVKKWFYIDMPLLQLFNDYGLRHTIGERIRKHALAREAEGYQSAAGIACLSHWAARCIVQDYGVPEERVHVVLPGASIDLDTYEEWEKSAASNPTLPIGAGRRPLRLVFVGRDWQRKGLDRLLLAMIFAQQRGLKAELRVIGCARESLPSELRQVQGVEWVGLVDKRVDALRYIQLVSECDVGCFVSRADASPISLREFHALGLAVLGVNVGGAREQCFPDASIELPADASTATIAAVLLELQSSPERVTRLKQAAWAQRRDALWPPAVAQLDRLVRKW